MSTDYTLPFGVTAKAVHLVSEISEIIGQLSADTSLDQMPYLRRSNRLRTIQASLAIENNTLSLEQVTRIIAGKKVLGPPKEIKEVQNAFDVYEQLEKLDPFKQKDLLRAHKILMKQLVSKSGAYRTGPVGIAKGDKVIHIAPPAVNVPFLLNDLFGWLKTTDVHPLIASSVFHYEFEFIHPFDDGNGRMGRLWQTLILSRWRPILAYLPVETIIYKNQDAYYGVLAHADRESDATVFVQFMLEAIITSLQEFNNTDPVSDPVTDPVKSLLITLENGPLSPAEIRARLNLKHRPSFRQNYLHPAMEANLIEQTIPDKPTSRLQKYKLSPRGKSLLSTLKNESTKGNRP